MDQQERIEQIMKEPHPLEASDHEEKIRRNLLLASAVSFCFTYLKLMPAKDTSFMGLKFENLTPETIYVLLLAFVVYELIQYSWLVTNKFMYWRVRLTGINTQVIRGNKGGRLASENDPYDYSGKPENSNFYTWMLESKGKIVRRKDALDSAWVDVEAYAFSSKELTSTERKDLLNKLNEIQTHTSLLDKSISNIRISASMTRFDNWFSMLVRSQSIRWVVLDFLLPISFSLLAITLLIPKICT
ncbi:hypothetical protein O1D11_003459 [Vibrio cholerae]|nr:hypothetical protein [Vibrio cholerae]